MNQLRRGGPLQTTTQILQKPVDYIAIRPDKWDKWLNWADDNGVTAPALIAYQWVRTNAPQKSYTNKSLAVMLKDDCILAKNHITQELHPFTDHKDHTRNSVPVDRAKIDAQIAADKAKQEAAQKATALTVATTWSEATDAPLVSGYMANKGLVCTHGARWHPQLNCWLIGLYDVHGKLWNLQRIYNRPVDNKRFMKSGRISGCFSLLGQLDINTRRILIAEGFATGASLREETGEVVACAMNAGNLQPACEAIRRAYPDINIIVCGDDDRAAPVNVGRQKANAAATSVNGKVVFPIFCKNCIGCTDWNDSIQCENKEAAR